jgi:hypothetical protein
MTRAAIVAAAIAALAPARAEAKHHCLETAGVVGYKRCSRFGDMWSHVPAFRLELGASMLRFAPGGFDASDGGYHLVPPPGDTRPIVAYGLHVRLFVPLSSSLYIAGDTDIAWIASAPALVPEATALATTTMLGGARGDLMQVTFPVGVQHALGPLTFAVEVGWGARISEVTSRSIHAGSFDPLIVINERAIAWLSPRWSVGVQIGSNVLRRDDFSAVAFVGAHLAPFDNLR